MPSYIKHSGCRRKKYSIYSEMRYSFYSYLIGFFCFYDFQYVIFNSDNSLKENNYFVCLKISVVS